MAKSGSTSKAFTSWDTLKFSWWEVRQSIENNTTTIGWKMELVAGQYGKIVATSQSPWTITVNGTKYTGKTNLGVENNATKTLASGETTIAHKTDGSQGFTYSFSQEFWITFDGASIGIVSGSGSGVLDTIPRSSTLTASNGTLGVEQTLAIGRASDTFKHRLTYRCGDVAEYIAGSATDYTTSVSIMWTPRLGLAAENTTGTSVSVVLTLYTYTSDGTHVGTTTQTITCAIPASVKPSCSIAWEDTTGLAGTYGRPVQGLSKIKVTVTAQTSQSSPIESYSITANGVTYSDASATTEALKAAGSQKINATVKDKRGRSGSNSATLDVLAYTAPVVSALEVHRCNADGSENDQGDHVRVKFSAAITNLVGLNPARYTLRYKASTAGSYTETALTGLDSTYVVSDYVYVFAADGSSSYDVEIVATDNHGTAARATSASTAFTLLNWNASGTGMGVGKVSEKENAVEFALDLYDKNGDPVLGTGSLIDLLMPVGFITLRYDQINPGTLYGGTWARISNYLLRGVAEGGQIGETGTLADGSGRTYVNIAIWRRTA